VEEYCYRIYLNIYAPQPFNESRLDKILSSLLCRNGIWCFESIYFWVSHLLLILHPWFITLLYVFVLFSHSFISTNCVQRISILRVLLGSATHISLLTRWYIYRSRYPYMKIVCMFRCSMAPRTTPSFDNWLFSKVKTLCVRIILIPIIPSSSTLLHFRENIGKVACASP